MSFGLLCVWTIFVLKAAGQVESSIEELLRNAPRSDVLISSSIATGSAATGLPSSGAVLFSNDTASRRISEISSSAKPSQLTTSTIDPVLACDREWATWSSSSLTVFAEPWSEATVTKVIVSTQTEYFTTYRCTSTCGNVCYADVTTTDTSFSTFTNTDFSTITKWAPFTEPTPSCTVPSDSCKSIWGVWSKSTSVYVSWLNTMGPPEEEPPWPYQRPGCEFCSVTACWIEADGPVKVHYFPVPTTVTRDMCTDFPSKGFYDPWQSSNYKNTTFTPITTGRSVVSDGYTFHEGNVYLSVPAASARNNCGSQLGSVHSNIMLVAASTDIYSGRNDQYGNYPIDYADFNTPYPWSAYKGALRDCASGMNFEAGPWCTRSVVFADNFFPVINLPSSMQNVDPSWAGCKPIVDLVDPPIALTADHLLPTPASGPAVSTPASPGSIPENQATQTKMPNHNNNNANAKDGGSAKSDSHEGPAPGNIATKPDEATRGNTREPPIRLTSVGPTVTIGATAIPVDPKGGGLIIDPGSVIQKGDPALTMSGTVISIGEDAVTVSWPAGTQSIPFSAATSASTIALGSQEVILDPRGELLVPGVTLRRGDPATRMGDKIVNVEGDGVTIMDPTNGAIDFIPFAQLRSQTVISAGGQTYTVDATGGLVLHPGKTLHVSDPAVTISGAVFSVGTSGIEITQGGQTRLVQDVHGRATTVQPAAAMGPGSVGWQSGGGSTAAPTPSHKGDAGRKSLGVDVFIILGLAYLILAFTG